ncbi:MAG: PIG-L deacetylase family protein [Sphaerochaetaceae bacterium]
MKNKPNLEPGNRVVLCIGAHPDDSEFRCGGTIALWSSLGDKILLLSLTDGSSGTFCESPERIRTRRRAEAINSAAVIHGQSLCMGCVDGNLEPSLENRKKLITLIRETQPDIILTNRPNDYHPDHRYTAQLVQDASYMLQVPNVVPEVPPLRYVPAILYWGDSFLYPYGFSPKAIVDIDGVLDAKISMLSQHESQLFEWLPWVDSLLDQVPPEREGEKARRDWVLSLYKRRAVPTYADRFRELLVAQYGKIKAEGIVEAEAYEVCEYGFRLNGEQLATIFKRV